MLQPYLESTSFISHTGKGGSYLNTLQSYFKLTSDSQQEDKMELSALFIRLLMNVLTLLVAQVHLNHSQENIFGEIIPTKLQLFEYKPVSFDCEGFEVKTGWTVMRKSNGKVSECRSTWETKRQSVCAISPTYQANSGEYWCETAAGEKSNTVNITVTDGAVILESPVRPVMEGDRVPLRCRSKMTSSAHIADFYKDGVLIGSGSLGEISIKEVSKSHEGFYTCSISDYRESPQSWLAVRAAPRETGPSPDHSCHLYLLLRVVLTIIMVALLLLLVGLLECGKIRVTPKYVCVCDVCKGSCQTEKRHE